MKRWKSKVCSNLVHIQKVGYQNHDALDTGKQVFPHNIHNPSQGSLFAK